VEDLNPVESISRAQIGKARMSSSNLRPELELSRAMVRAHCAGQLRLFKVAQDFVNYYKLKSQGEDHRCSVSSRCPRRPWGTLQLLSKYLQLSKAARNGVRPSSTPYCGLTFRQDKVVKAAQLGLLGHAIIRRHFFLSYSDPRYRYKQKVKEANAKEVQLGRQEPPGGAVGRGNDTRLGNLQPVPEEEHLSLEMVSLSFQFTFKLRYFLLFLDFLYSLVL